MSAGEPSGDLHGGPVVAALRTRFPGARIEALGGPLIRAAGAEVVWAMEDYTVMGFAEIIGKIPAHYRLLQTLRQKFAAGQIDLVVLIDYPGFHLRVAEAARQAGIPVVYYIAPQLWAWRPERARRFRQAVDRFAVIFPFEEAFFRDLGLVADYVGHPLMDRPAGPTKDAARQALGVAGGARVLALFPGSRRQEIDRHWQAFRDASLALLQADQVDRVVVATIADADYPNPGPLVLWAGESATVLAAADAAILKSGTTVLEAALADIPMVVAYRVHRLTAWFARRVMRVQWISLVNLIAGRGVVEEILQDDVTATRLAAAAGVLLDGQHPTTQAQRAGLAQVRALLGGPGAADRVAAIAAELVE